MKKSIFAFLCTVLSVVPLSQAASVFITDLGSETPDAPGPFSAGTTAQNIFEVGTTRDGDATFTFAIDFSAFSGGATQTQNVFEIGGHANGFSLVYQTGNTLRLAVTGSGELAGTHVLTASQLAAGNLNFVATVQVNNSGDESIGLFIDGTQVISETGVDIGSDWAGGNNSNFITFSGGASNIAGNYSPVPVGLVDGTLSGTFDYYQDVYVIPVPEPSTYALLMLGVGSLYFLRRKNK